MQYYTQRERDEHLSRSQSYLVIYFLDDSSDRPVVERMTSEEVKYFKDTRPLTFKKSCILQGELYKGFNSEFLGLKK